MITITIQPQSPEHVMILAKAMAEMLKQFDEPEVKEEAPAKKPKATKAAPVIETPAEPEAPPAAPTLEEVRAKLVAYKDKGNTLKDLFETVGCANLSAVPAERYAELLDNMKARNV